MRRSDYPCPFQTMLIDLNAPAAYADEGLPVRAYPRILPIPPGAVSEDADTLILEPWRRDVKLYPQLYFLVGRDLPQEAAGRDETAVLGYGLGLAFRDNGILLASPGAVPRDEASCFWYSLYTDGSQILSDEMLPEADLSSVVLTISSKTAGRAEYPQKDLLFDGGRILNETREFIEFRKYDLIALGCAGTPLFLPADRKFEEDEILTVDGGVFGTMNITIKDRRDPAVCIPGWKPRAFFKEEGYLR